jgi:hypothetical protein
VAAVVAVAVGHAWVLLALRLAGDPDIDTVPVLAWSTKMGRAMLSAGPVGRFMIRYQGVLYFPVLFFARLSWLLQSFLYVVGARTHSWGQHYGKEPLKNPTVEALTLALYYTWYLGIM